MLDLKDFNSLAEAQAYTVTEPLKIDVNDMRALLGENGLYVALKNVAEDNNSPFQDRISAFMEMTEYSFEAGTLAGDFNRGIVIAIANSSTPLAAPMAIVRDELLALSQFDYRPYEEATLHQYMTATGTCPKTAVTPVGNVLSVTYASDVEGHNPVIWAEFNGVPGKFYRVANLGQVESAGDYVARLPVSLSTAYIDDPYSAVS
jgi:hypothetical protein